MRYRGALAFAGFTTWVLSGLVLDGWSHNANQPETFFTPWHGLLYSGFLASAAWGAFDGARARRRGTTTEEPLADRWTGVGVWVFALGMVGDFAWHQVFGIEVEIDALLSPTHLLLFSGGLLLVTTPLRVGLAGAVERLPVLVAAAGTIVLAGFFTMYLSAFRGTVAAGATSRSGGHGSGGELLVVQGIAMVLVTTVVVVVPLLVAVRVAPLPPGALAAVVGVAALGLSALDGFDRPALVLAGLLAGAAADVAVAVGRPALVGVAAPLVLWPVWFAVLRIDGSMAWNAELWSGSCVLAVVLGAGLSALALTPTPRSG